MADTDLTSTILGYTDRHLGLPLLSHLADLETFNKDDIAKATYDLVRGTSMWDYAISLHEQAFPGQAPPADLVKQSEEQQSVLERLTAEADRVLTVIEDPTLVDSLKQDKAQNLHYLEEKYQLTADQINALYRLGYYQYSAGKYSEASSYLYHFRVLSIDQELTTSSHWGKMAADVLSGEWDRALEEVKLLREQIDSSRPDEGGHEAVLQKRTWLLHWSLFIWFNHPEGREGLVEMYLSPPYLNTIQTTCWWLLRYLVAALVLTRRSTRTYIVSQPVSSLNPGVSPTMKLSPAAALRDVTRALSLEAHRTEKDPILNFVRQLCVEFDFEKSQEELRKAQEVANNDFFLWQHADAFVESARFLVSEAYCRIHQRVDIGDLSKRLNMTKDEGEKWIVNLVRDTKGDAKIDFKEGMVYMNQTTPAVYQSVIEKTRGFTFRTAAMGQAMDRKAHPITVHHNEARGGGGGGRGGRGGGRGGGQRGGGDRGANKDNQNQNNQNQQQQQQQQQQQPNGVAPTTPAQEITAA